MASENPLGAVRLPSPGEVIELLADAFAGAGYEIEDVVIDGTGRPPRVVVIADAEDGVDLAALATLSRSASDLLDRLDDRGGEAAYLLEVTSRGVDRPLTAERHFRRARGRKVDVTLSDGTRLTGRVGEVSHGSVRLVVADRRGALVVHQLDIGDITNAVVQVEFSPPNRLELELAGVAGKEADE